MAIVGLDGKPVQKIMNMFPSFIAFKRKDDGTGFYKPSHLDLQTALARSS